jgi:hypothetical protein
MTSPITILNTSLQDVKEAISDLRNSQVQTSENVLARVVHLLDQEPLAGFLASVLPEIDFDTWWVKSKKTVGSFAGSGVLDWPIDRPTRVAMQIALCRGVTEGKIPFFDFLLDYFYPGTNSIPAHIQAFSTKLLDPLVRDIGRLTESRPVTPILFEAARQLPTSGDAMLDKLLQDACSKFRDPAPQARMDATEKLWDAWERLKSLEESSNKALSVKILLDKTTDDPLFRGYLEREAKALTEIGNTEPVNKIV